MSSQRFLFENWHLLISMVASNDTSEKKKMYQNHNISLQNHEITKCRPKKTWLKNLKKITEKNMKKLVHHLMALTKNLLTSRTTEMLFLPMMSSKKSTDDDANVFRAPKNYVTRHPALNHLRWHGFLGWFLMRLRSLLVKMKQHMVYQTEILCKRSGNQIFTKIQNLLSCWAIFCC